MSKPTSEHLLALAKAGLNAVPVVGGSIASLIGDYVPTATQRNVDRTLASLRSEVEALGNRVDVDTINREEFSEIFKSAYLVAMRTHNEAKLRAAVKLVANVLLRDGDHDKLSYMEVDHYARCLDLLSSGGVQVLAHAVRIAEKQAPGRLVTNSVATTFEQLRVEMPEVAPSLLMGLVGELDGLNLVHRAGVPAIRTPDYGNYSIEVTPLGGRFAKHLLAAV